jgi:hypothetical protein
LQHDHVFSQITNFCKNEAGLARNVKDRQNSRVTVRNLERIQNEIKLLKDKDLEMGLFVFAGIDTYGTEIFKMIRPKMRLNKFSYKCLNKFIVDGVHEYLKVYDGSIVFANGDTFYVYVHGNLGFEQVKYKKVDLGNRHNKGGQSQHRHERNFDIVKDYYISVIAEETMKLNTENNWIFGSLEIINKVVTKNPKLQNGGFVDFNKYTINDTKKWLSYLQDDTKQIKREEHKLEHILTLLQIDPDRLNFDPNDKENMEWYMLNEDKPDLSEARLPCKGSAIYLNTRHKQYSKLFEFPYIGVKYNGVVTYDDQY